MLRWPSVFFYSLAQGFESLEHLAASLLLVCITSTYDVLGDAGKVHFSFAGTGSCECCQAFDSEFILVHTSTYDALGGVRKTNWP